MRPRQWTKNLIVFAPLIFSGHIQDVSAIVASVVAFGVFCLASGATYLVNDVRDAHVDRLHEVKRTRPVASGELPATVAVVSAIVIAVLAVAVAFALARPVGVMTLGYLALQAAYTFGLKHQVILDVMSISAGFIIRAAAGAAAVSVAASPWLYMCAALLALFLGFGKRRHELLLAEGTVGSHRAVLDDYSPHLLDVLVATATSGTIIAYSLYTFFSPTAAENDYLMFTIPFVVYGVLRYVFLMYKHNLGGSPEEILLTDVPLIITILAWLATASVVIYLT